MARKFEKELDGGDVGKVTAFSEVALKLLVVSARDDKEELARLFTNVWLEILGSHSAAIERNTQAAEGVLSPVTDAFRLEIGTHGGAAARCILRIGLSSLVGSIEKNSTHLTVYIAMTWVPIIEFTKPGGNRSIQRIKGRMVSY